MSRCALLLLASALGLACRAPAPPVEPASSSEPAASERDAEGEQEARSTEPTVAAPEQEGTPVLDIDLSRNSGEALLASVDAITHLELSDGQRVVLRFDDAVRDELVESLREAEIVDSLAMTPSPWPEARVLIHVEGRDAPFVASILAGGQLRLNAREPWGNRIADEEGAPDFEKVRDLGYSEALWDAAAAELGPGESIEHRRPRGGPSLDDPFGD